MNRNFVLPVAFCLVATSLASSPPAVAYPLQLPVERSAVETASVTTQKPKPATITRPTVAKSTSASPKSPTTTTAKAKTKPGKRFWGRIMDAFRDVHSVEKKTNK